ncbi:MAG TPA: hypothetical protein VF916_01085, partial [Ktedonobacterales bacterium]
PAAVLAALPRLAQRVATWLQAREQGAREVRLGLRGDDGRLHEQRHLLRDATAAPAPLHAVIERLVRALVVASGMTGPITELRLALGDLAPRCPTPASLWGLADPRRTRSHTITTLAETLARRSGHPLLVQARPTRPAAIFMEERYALRPLALDQAVAAEPAPTPLLPVQSAWHEVPQRLHWW